MTDDKLGKLLRIAAVLALVALALIVWSLVDPTPIPVIVSMSVGQVIGTASFGVFLFVIAIDLRHERRRRRTSMELVARTADGAAAADARPAGGAAATVLNEAAAAARDKAAAAAHTAGPDVDTGSEPGEDRDDT